MVHTSMQGTTVNFSYTNNPSWGQGYKIWVDWNQNGLFTDAGEQMFSGAATTPGGATVSNSFTVPLTATPGPTRMRVRCVYASTTFTPCGLVTYGEVEDYGFTVTAAAPCAGVPTAGSTTGPASVCPATSFTLGLSATTSGSGVTYQWQNSPDNITYTNIGGATSAGYSTTQSVATYYQCIVTCTSSGLVDTSASLLVNMNGFMGCYCASMPTTTADEEITNVTLGTLNNNSTCATVAPGPGSIATRYGNYMSGAGAPAAPYIARTSPTSVSVTVGSCGSFNYTSGLAIFMDLNQNGLFTDAGEKVYSNGAASNINCVPATVVSGTITIPATAMLGITAMRIINAEGYSGNAITPCLSFGYGETEDYTVNIVDLPPTPPTPMQSVTVPTCVTGTDLTVPGSPAAGDAWYWQTSGTGTSTATPVAGAYTVFLNGTYYVRTYNATTGFWSTSSSSYTVTNIPVAPTPPAPTATTPACLTTNITAATPPASTTYYWQGTNATGTSTTMDAATPYTATASGTYYLAAFDASTSCWSNTSSLAVVIDTFVPAAPTSTADPLNICLGTPTAMINAAASAGTGSAMSSFGTMLTSNGSVPTTVTITVPAIPAGATVTSTQLQVIGAEAIGGSYRSEIRVALSGTITLAPYQISTLTSPGIITPDPSVTVPLMPAAGGSVTLSLTETFNDGGTAIDATFNEVRLVVNYTTAATITWWDASTAGTNIGTGSPFESVGTTVMPNTNTLGTYMFYAQATAGTCNSTSRLGVDVVVNPLPVVTASATATTICAGSSVTLTGAGATTYTWDNGVTDAVAFSAPATTTVYSVIGADGFGCADTTSITLNVNPLPVPSASSTPILCNAGTSTVTVTATGGTPGYVGTGTFTQSAGTVIYTVTDTNSCSNTVSVAITEPDAIVVSPSTTPILCNGGSSTVTISASGGTGILSGTGFFPQTAADGTVTYTVTDGNSCTGTASVTVTEPAPLTSTYAETGVLCNAGTSNVTVTAAGGVAPWDYVWDNAGGTFQTTTDASGSDMSALTAGSYTVTITDANACVTTSTIVVTEPTVLAGTFTSTGISCFGGNDTITITATGGTAPYIGEGTFLQPDGTVVYNLTDANGCAATVSVSTTEPTELFMASGATLVLCNGDSSTVTISAIGGTPAYMGTGNFMQAAGTVTYNVTDANGCMVTSNVTVTEPTAVVASIASAGTILCNGDSASVTVAATGGTGAYMGTGTFMQAAGTIDYIVTDANGCPDTTSQMLTEPTAVMVMFSSTPVLCNGDSSAVTITGMDGTPGYTGEGTFNQAAGTVTYTLTDANGCTGSSAVTITEPAAITGSQSIALCPGGSVTVGSSTYNTAGTFIDVLTAANTCDSTVTTTILVNTAPVVAGTADDDTVCAGTLVTLTGSGASTYAWDNSVVDGVAFTPASTLVYSVVGTDVNGCMDTASVTVVVNPLPAVTLSPFMAPVCVQAPTFALTGGSPAGGIYSGTGVTGGMFDPTVGGVGVFPITYTVTDTNSCTSAASNNITVQDCTGIEDNANSDNVSVYPNPTIGSFTITILNANFAEMVISIVDIQGKDVYTSSDKNVSGTFTKEINFSELSKGVYYIRVSTDANVIVKKLIVQ